MVMKVEEIINREPVELPEEMPNHSEWIEDLAIQSTIYYTGYPNRGGPYTFDGRVVSIENSRAFYIDSYAWSGSSGAGVFSASGNLIGWVVALDIGQTMYGRQVLENFIWVAPLHQVEWPVVWALTDI
jgi:V8-like Glu-specific endopeptidase